MFHIHPVLIIGLVIVVLGAVSYVQLSREFPRKRFNNHTGKWVFLNCFAGYRRMSFGYESRRGENHPSLWIRICRGQVSVVESFEDRYYTWQTTLGQFKSAVSVAHDYTGRNAVREALFRNGRMRLETLVDRSDPVVRSTLW